jgi:hypothetical protein
MTAQPRNHPKTAFHVRLTNANYDFLCGIASRGEKSLAKALNELIEAKRSGTTICNPRNERVMVNYDGRRPSHSQRHGCV